MQPARSLVLGAHAADPGARAPTSASSRVHARRLDLAPWQLRRQSSRSVAWVQQSSVLHGMQGVVRVGCSGDEWLPAPFGHQQQARLRLVLHALGERCAIRSAMHACPLCRHSRLTSGADDYVTTMSLERSLSAEQRASAPLDNAYMLSEDVTQQQQRVGFVQRQHQWPRPANQC